MTGTANKCVFSVAVITCFDSCLFAFCFSMLCAWECHKFTNGEVLIILMICLEKYLVPDGQDIKFLSFEKYWDIEKAFYCKLRWEEKRKNLHEISGGNYLQGKDLFQS